METPTCPHCNKKQSQKPMKEWKYSVYAVSRYECKCGKSFRWYVSPKSTWTIPKKKV